LIDTCITAEKGADMQQALRPIAAAGIAILGTGSFMAFTPVAPPLPDVHSPAIQLSTDSSLLGDFSSLFDGVTGGTSGIGGLSDLTGDVTGLLGGLNPTSLLSDLPGLASVDPAPADPSLLTPYIDLFTNSFANLQTIGTEFADETLPALQAALQELIANPSLIADLPLAVFNALSTPATITTDLTSLPLTIDVMLGAPLVLGLGFVGPLAPTSEALEAVYAALTSGDPTQVLPALIDGPAEIANAYLNGSVGLDVLGIDVPLLNGILVPDANVPIDVDVTTVINALDSLNSIPALSDVLGPVIDVVVPLLEALPPADLANITVGPFGGIVDAVVNYLPLDILTTDPGGTSILSGLDPSTLLSGLDLGNLGGLVDPSTLLGDVTALLPGVAADVPAQLATDLSTLIPF
jgi:hypothetical protein